MTDLTDEALDKLVAILNEPLEFYQNGEQMDVDEDEAYNRMERAAATITALRQREATAVAGAKAEGMREAAEIAHRMASTDANMSRTWRAGCEDVAEAIHRAADKLEGKP